MPERQFMLEVAGRSDLVVFGKVTDYSNARDRAAQWTDFAVIQAIHPKDKAPPASVRVRGWQSLYHPLYNDDRGSYLVLFLEREGEDYALTSDEWKHCVPSVWNAKEDRTAYRNLEAADESPDGWIAIEEIGKLVVKE